jgi:serine/threonine-protein kinase
VIELAENLGKIAGAYDPIRELAQFGRVFAVFDDQDSECLSYGVAVDGARWFVKLAPDRRTARSLRSAAEFHAAVKHPVIVAPATFTDVGDRAGIVYPWVSGSVLYHPTKSRRMSRTAPASPLRAFREQPLEIVSRVVDEIFDAHLAVAAAGFVAVDFFDGCMLYDPHTTVIRLIDLDLYRRGPFTVEPGPIYGSTRYLSPEERVTGATVDERTMVHLLGRTARMLMDEGDQEQAWRGTAAQLAVLGRATRQDPAERYRSVAEFIQAWRETAPESCALAG